MHDILTQKGHKSMTKVCTHHLIAQHSICQVQIGLGAAVACAQWQGCVRRSPDAVCVVAGAGPACLEACRDSRREEQCGPAGNSKHLHNGDSSQNKCMCPKSLLGYHIEHDNIDNNHKQV